jgi:hypothetical protein
MTEPIVVRLKLQNGCSKPQTISLEPYGDFCQVDSGTVVPAQWEFSASGDLEIEIYFNDDGLSIWNAGEDGELLPRRDLPGGEYWASAEQPSSP